jgi:hypothetical protein
MYAHVMAVPRLAPSRVRQVVALVAVLAVAFFSLGGALRVDRWAFSRPTLPRAAAATGHVGSGVDVDAVIEHARHTVTPVPGGAATLEVSTGDYQLTFQGSGFTYRPAPTAASLTIGTESLARGGQRIGFDVGRWTANGDMAGRDLAPAVREQVTARSDAVEWDVVLASRPAGHGDLVLRAGVDGVVGAPEVVAGGRTLRLRLVNGATVDVGETVVVDAAGRELYRGLPAIAHGRVELMVPDAVLEQAAYPITIDPTVSSGQLVSTPSALAQQPSIAFDGEDYLVAWNEYDGSNFEIRAAQVNGAGTIVQPIGFLSTQGDSRDDQRPAVAWNGTRFLVTWEHTFGTGDIDVYGRIVNRAGFPIGSVFSVVAPVGNQTFPSVTAVGATFFVVWSDDRTGAGDIRGARVTNAGAVLDASPGVTVASAANAETQPDIAATSGALLVSYQYLAAAGNPDVYAQRTNLSLQPIGTAIPLATTAAPEQDAKVASDGTGYLVVWGGTGDIQGRRVLPDGSLPGAALIPISTAPDNQSIPDVAFNGAYLVAWKDNRNFWNEIWAARVASDGTVQDPSGFRIFDQATNQGTAAIQNPPSVARGPGSKWAVDHEAVFGGIFHYSVAPK